MTHIQQQYIDAAETEEDKALIRKLNDTEPYKQLGVKRTLAGESQDSGKATIAKLLGRLERLTGPSSSENRIATTRERTNSTTTTA